MEGIDGRGKTTNLDFVKELLEGVGVRVVSTREPGGTQLGEGVRQLLLNSQDLAIGSDAETLLIFAARAQHISEVIEPSLARGLWVLCDRFTDATYAYQGGGRGLAIERIATLEEWVQGTLRPDLTLLLDVPVEVGVSRATFRGAPDRFEYESHKFSERVRKHYLRMAQDQPGRIKIIDASRPLGAVHADLRRAIAPLVAKTAAKPPC